MTSIHFVLKTKNYDQVISKLNLIEGLKIISKKEPTLEEIACKAEISRNEVFQTASICSQLLHIDPKATLTQIFPQNEDEKKLLKKIKFSIFIPAIISALLTFFTIFGQIGLLKSDFNFNDVFFISGIPTIITFLTHSYNIWYSNITFLKRKIFE